MRSLQRPEKSGDLSLMSVLWCNGDWIDEGAFVVSASDRGLLHGFGLFETLLAVDGRAPFADRHIERMTDGAQNLGWDLDGTALTAAISGLLERNGLSTGRAKVRLAMTAGSGPLEQIATGNDRCLWMTAARLELASEPLSVMVAPWRRNERSPLAGLKCASYAENLLALQEAKRVGFDEALFFNTSEHLCEAAMANVFLVQGGRLLTPSLESGCLPGVTRAVVMEAAAEMGVACEEATLTHIDLEAADEVFLSSSLQGPRSVARIGEQEFPCAEVTSSLAHAWQQLVQADRKR